MYCYVYVGKKNNEVVYVGTTIQNPIERFRWHKNNGKNLEFEVLIKLDNTDDMLKLEYNLIKNFKPSLNKIIDRPQNLNVKLNDNVIESRKGDIEWCQSCLKRRVTNGYKYCKWCS